MAELSETAASARETALARVSSRLNGDGSSMSNVTMQESPEAALLELFHNQPQPLLLISADTGDVLDANQAACEYYDYNHTTLLKRTFPDLCNMPKKSVESLFGEDDGTSHERIPLNQRLASGEIRDALVSTATVHLFGHDLYWVTLEDITEEAYNRKVRALLLDISEAASVADDIHAFIGLVRDRLSDFLDTTNFYVALYDDVEDIYHFPFYTDEQDDVVETERLGGSITDYIRRTGRSMLVDQKLERKLTELGEIQLVGTSSPIYLGVPLRTSHGIIGVIAVQHYTDQHAYVDSDLDLLEFVSGPLAVLIERLRAESALRDSEANFRTFIRESAEGIVFCDPNDILLTVNREFQQIFGYQSSELIGRTNERIVPPDLTEESAELVHQARAQRVIKLETKRRAFDGSDVEVSIMGVPIHRDNKHVGTYWVYRDLTDQRRSETLQDVQFEITKAATTSGDLNDVMIIVHQQLSKLIDASNFFVALYNPDTHDYEFPYFVDEEEEVQPGQRFSMQNSMTDHVRCHGSLLLRSEDEVTEVAAREGIQTYPPMPRSWLGVQLQRPDRVIGVVVVQSYKRNSAYEARDLELLEFVSSQIASVIEHKREQVALMESEERHRALFAQSPVGVLLYDHELTITDCNLRHAEIMGAESPQELIGTKSSEHNRRDLVSLMRSALHGNTEYYEGEYKPKRTTGELWLSMNFSPYYGADRQVVGGLAVIVDNTQRHAAEKRAATSQAYQEQLFEGAPEAIVILNPDMNILRINQEFTHLFGFSPEEAEGVDLRDLILPTGDTFDQQYSEYIRLQQGYMAKIDETQCRRKNGSLVNVSLLGTPIEIDEEIVGLYAIYRDITKRKEATDELAAEKDRLAVTLASLGEGVITTDIKGRVTMINGQASKLTGWSWDSAVGQDIDTVFPLRDEQTGLAVENPVYRALDLGVLDRWNKELVLTTQDGMRRLVVGSATPVHNRAEDVVGSVIVFRDMSEQRKMEEEVAKIERLESVGVLAGGIAHDFNNILSAIVGNISVARMMPDDADFISKRLEEAEKATMRARELTQQLLTFSKGGQPVRKAASVSELLRESADFTLRGSNVGVEYAIDEDLWPAEIDESQISRVINNLVLNGDQAMSDGGTIWVRASNIEVDPDSSIPLDTGRYVAVEVEDNGPGIPESVLQKIFDPFFTTKSSGTGLGLATSFSIVQKHDGLLSVESTVGSGTMFRIFLPASDNEVIPEIEDTNYDDLGKGRVLVMDDEESVRDIASVMLSNLGFETVAVPDGKAALEAYEQAMKDGERFDVVIIDLTIPGGMGGEEAMRHLLELDPDICAIVSSGYSNDPVMADHLTYGFKGVMAKPYLVHDLQRELRKVLKGQT